MLGERGRPDGRGWRLAEHIPVWFCRGGAGRETKAAATRTVAPPKIRVDLRAFAVQVALPRNLFSLNWIHIQFYTHAKNLTISAENQKTYGRLFGMIFFGGLESLLHTVLQRLATHGISKNRQNTKAK